MALMDKMMDGMLGSMSSGEKQDTMLKLMPEMMKRVKGSEIAGMIAELMSGMMFVTHKSRLGFAETIQEIKRQGEEAGWYNPTIHNHLEIENEPDGPDDAQYHGEGHAVDVYGPEHGENGPQDDGERKSQRNYA